MTWWIGLHSYGPMDSEVQQDGRIINNYKNAFKVQTDAGSYPTESAITGALGIYPGSPYPNDANATCHKVAIAMDVKTRPPWLTFYVACEWSTAAVLPVTDSTDPTTMRTIWSQRGNIQSRFITRDSADKVITNSAGQPPDGGIPVDIRLGTIIAKRKITAVGFSKPTWLANNGKLNSVTYLGGQPGTVQMDYEDQESYEGGYHFIDQTFTFAYDPSGWQPEFPNAGFFQKIGGILQRLLNKDIGSPVDPDKETLEPEPLDKDGLLVPVGNRGTTNNAVAGYCSTTKVTHFGTMDFNALGL